ncbi:MAG: signal peptide peptidase SppA [Erythrobacter sp.]
MSFAGKIWRFLVGVKDALALLFLLLFFVMLFALLSSRPNPGAVQDGALLLDLNGYVVEEKSVVDPIDALLSQQAPMGEYPVHKLVHALDSAATDDRISVVALDLSGFVGGGQVQLQAVGEAMDKVRKAEKPVIAYSLGYADAGIMLAAHASEVWLDPLGGAIVAGPGGQNLYYAELLEKLKVDAKVYRVGTYKSAVEPYLRSDMSEESRENYAALYGSLWEEWQAHVKKARPEIDLDMITGDPAAWVAASGGDLAEAALAAGMVDKLGTRVEWGNRIAEIAGEDDFDESPGSFAATELEPWLADNSIDTSGEAIGVITVAGEIVDGQAGPGTAGGDRIAELLDDALEDDLKALVVRVNSPGGSVTASEAIREAILRHKAADDIPIAVSFANVAASGGYWVGTAGDRIFAEPETITGSIGIFAVLPTFDRAARDWGVNADGYRTTPLSGQPDFVGGFTPEVDAILQSSIENGYSDFINLVAKSRGKTAEQVDAVGQGRVWDGGTARQLGLVDQFGGLEEALEWAAGEAGLEEGDWHAKRLGGDADPYQSVLSQILSGGASANAAPVNGDMFTFAARGQAQLSSRMIADLDRITSAKGMQAYCLECPSPIRPLSPQKQASWWQAFAGLIAR